MQPEGERILTVPEEMGDVKSPMVTGNEWVSLPDISQADASISSANVIHMGSRGLVEWVGSEEPFLAPCVFEGSEEGEALAPCWSWRRLADWIPCAQSRIRPASGDEFTLTLTICAPVGERGFVIRFELSDLSPAPSPSQAPATERHAERQHQMQGVKLAVGLKGHWAATLNTIFTRRGMHVVNHAFSSAWTKSIVLEARGASSVAAMATACSLPMQWTLAGSDGQPAKSVQEPGDGSGQIRFRVWTYVTLEPGQTRSVDFWFAVNADPDGAATTCVHLRRVGYQDALSHTIDWLQSRSHRNRIAYPVTGPVTTPLRKQANEETDAISRADYNLHFCRFFAHGRAIDTEELVMLTSRSPRYYVSAAFWPRDAFLWAFPAMLSSDPAFAREALLTGFARHANNMGTHAHYIDGVLLYPGFELDQHASYVIALGSYMRHTGDASIAGEPQVAAGLGQFEESLPGLRHRQAALYRTFLDPSDDPVKYPYLTYDNVLLWKALTLLAEIAHATGDEAAATRRACMARDTRAAVLDHLVADGPFGPMFVWSADLEGQFELYDDPPGSLLLLPHYDFTRCDDPVFANTVRFVMSEHNPYRVARGRYPGVGCAHAARPWPMQACNMLMAGGHEPELLDESLKLISQAPLDGGLACESIYETTGKVATGGAFATFAGYLSTALAKAVARKAI